MITSQEFVAAREHHREAVRVSGLTSFARLLYLTRAQKAENCREVAPDVDGLRILCLRSNASEPVEVTVLVTDINWSLS